MFSWHATSIFSPTLLLTRFPWQSSKWTEQTHSPTCKTHFITWYNTSILVKHMKKFILSTRMSSLLQSPFQFPRGYHQWSKLCAFGNFSAHLNLCLLSPKLPVITYCNGREKPKFFCSAVSTGFSAFQLTKLLHICLAEFCIFRQLHSIP